MSVLCSHCGIRFPFDSHYAGKAIRCCICNHLTAIPEADPIDDSHRFTADLESKFGSSQDMTVTEYKEWLAQKRKEERAAKGTITRAVAKWMASEFRRAGGRLVQREVAERIGKQFGADFTYHNGNGNLGIEPGVLAEFQKLTRDTVVWSKLGQYWRERKPGDPANRRDVD